MRDLENIKFVSIASLWEIAIKVNLGKIQLDFDFKDFMTLLSINGFEVLSIEFEHTRAVAALPLHHRDPFDRILIAQSLVNEMIIVTRDPCFSDYEVPILW